MMNISATLAAAVGLAASTEETRYYLQGIHVEPHPDEGVLIVATDGHMLAVAHDPEGHVEGDILVKLDFKSKDLKTPRRGQPRRLIVQEFDKFGGSAGRIEDGGVLEAPIKVDRIDGTFPDWRRIMGLTGKGWDGATKYAWNPKLIQRVGQIYERAGWEGGCPLTIYQNGPHEPAHFVVGGINYLLVVGMPGTKASVDSYPADFWSRRFVAEEVA